MPPRPTSIALPFLAACGGIALFSVMDTSMKGLSIAIGAYNAMFWRVIIGTLASGALFVAARGRWPRGAAWRLHLIRGAVTAVMAVLFFWGLARVPMAEAVALSFIAPLIAFFLAAVMLGETVGPRAITGSLLGTAGVSVILAARIGGDYGPAAVPGALAVLASACFYAWNIILMRQQALVAGPVEVAFCQNLTVTGFLALAAPFLAVVPGAEHLPALTLSGTLAIGSLLLLSWAYARAEAQALIAVEYTAFGWAALFGWLVFGERLTAVTIGGTVLIVIGCIVAARRPRAASPTVEAML